MQMALMWLNLYSHEAVMPEPGGPGGPLAPPIFGRSVNPIPTGGGQIMPTITTGPPKVFHLPASLSMKLILDDQGNHMYSYPISLESSRSRCPLFRKPVLLGAK